MRDDGTDSADGSKLSATDPPDRTLDDVAGLDAEVAEFRRTILQSFSDSVPSDLRAVSAVVHGPRGAGKRRFVKSVAGAFGERGWRCDHLQSLSDYEMRPTEAMRELLMEAREQEPFVLFLDMFDDNHIRSGTVRVFDQQVEAIREHGDEVVLLSVIDSSEFHASSVLRFLQAVDLVVNLERPNIDRRREILSRVTDRVATVTEALSEDAYDIDRLARATDKFGVDELHEVGRRTILSTRTTDGATPPLTESDLLEIVDWVDDERIESVQDEYALEDVDLPEVTFGDIGGLDGAIRKLTEQVRHDVAHGDTAEAFDIQAGGVLLHGPPGTGKTMLVRALANELNYTFIPVSCPELKSRHGGGPAAKIPTLFERAARNSPAILFFDEFDSIGGRRGTRHADEPSVNTLLTELDGLTGVSDVVTIGATNRPETLDPALLRPGRFDYHIEVPKPDSDGQMQIFQKQAADLPLAADVTPEWFVSLVDDVTGADITTICQRAVSVRMRADTVDDADDLHLTRATFETAYEEFEAGRLHDGDLTTGRAFQ